MRSQTKAFFGIGSILLLGVAGCSSPTGNQAADMMQMKHEASNAEASTPDAGKEPCDPMGNAMFGPVCRNEAGAGKCTYVQTAAMSPSVLECTTPKFTMDGGGTPLAANSPTACLRYMGEPGLDDCAAGSFCSGLGQPEAMKTAKQRYCRSYCRADSDCLATQKCLLFDWGYSPKVGICIDACDPTLPTAGVCPAGTACTIELVASLNVDSVVTQDGRITSNVLQPICDTPGTTPQGGVCNLQNTFPQDCVGGTGCFEKSCSSKNPCPSGDTCLTTTACKTSSDCFSNFCNTATGMCAFQCNTNTDCPGTGTCTAGICSTGTCGATTVCQPFCDTTHPCPGTANCSVLNVCKTTADCHGLGTCSIPTGATQGACSIGVCML